MTKGTADLDLQKIYVISLKTDRDIEMIAVGKSGYALKFASKELWADFEIDPID